MNILFLIFNRPDKTRQVFEKIRYIKPDRLFIGADGPRRNREKDQELCRQTRDIVKEIDWPCEVHTLFREENKGCKNAVAEAINWFFKHVEEGIILEDDCVPDNSFFEFAQTLLEHYRDDERVMHIGGTTFLEGQEVTNSGDSYHFSHVAHVWGWATWRRAWKQFDVTMSALDTLDESQAFRHSFAKKSHRSFWIRLFKHVRKNNIDTWDAQLMYTLLKNEGLAITPHTNLIKNIGFDLTATHTTDTNTHEIDVSPISFPLTHPTTVTPDTQADMLLMDKVYMRSLPERLKALYKRLITIF